MKLLDTKIRLLFKDIFYPEGFSAKMGRIVAALSILALINNSFHLGIGVTFRMLFTYYEDMLKLLFSWTEPDLHLFVQHLSTILHLRLKLSETWHHVFVVMWILFMRDLSVAFSDGRIKLSVVRGLSGFCVAVVFSFLSTIEIGATNSVVKNAQLAIMPYIGIYAYDLIMYAYSALVLKHDMRKIAFIGPLPTRTKHFKVNAKRAHWRLALILGAIGICFFIPTFLSAPYPQGGLIILAIATIVNLLYWVFRGVFYARRAQAKEDNNNLKSFYSFFLESEAGRFSIAVGSVMVWIFTFIVLNEGAKILGL